MSLPKIAMRSKLRVAPHLFPEQSTAATLDDVEERVYLVRAVNGQIKVRLLV